jgi:hypothetical protein
MLNGVELALALLEHNDVEAALTAYETGMFPRAALSAEQVRGGTGHLLQPARATGAARVLHPGAGLLTSIPARRRVCRNGQLAVLICRTHRADLLDSPG